MNDHSSVLGERTLSNGVQWTVLIDENRWGYSATAAGAGWGSAADG